MSAESNTPIDIETWIVKTINSCTSIPQFIVARKLINLYYNKISAETELSWSIRNAIKDRLMNEYKSSKSNWIQTNQTKNG
jgi:hypothetical protein